jgi:hypothetical protein
MDFKRLITNDLEEEGEESFEEAGDKRNNECAAALHRHRQMIPPII